MTAAANVREPTIVGDYTVRRMEPGDVDGARSVMLDTVYQEFGHGYLPRFHTDIIDIAACYLAPPDHAMFVAERDGAIVATAGVREQTPTSPPHPAEVAAGFEPGRTASLYRVYVRREHRRRGLAGALVDQCTAFAASRERYTGIYLHTDARVPGAVAFWSRRGEVLADERDGRADEFQTVHFRIKLPR
jgi:GNAT superfamily N-acetyltransferase